MCSHIQTTLPTALFLIMMLGAVWTVYRASNSLHPFRFFDLFTSNGQADVYKLIYFTVALAMVWVLFFLTVNSQLTEFFVTSIVFGVALAGVADGWQRRHYGTKPDAQPGKDSNP